MVKTAKTKHTHRRRVRYPARFFGTTGYVCLTIVWLLVIGLAGSLAIDFFSNIFPTVSDAPVGTISTFFTYHSSPTTPEDLPLAAKAVLFVLLVGVVLLLGHFVASKISHILKHILHAIGAKVTLGLLLGTKMVSLLLAVLAMMVAVLGLPMEAEFYMQALVGLTALVALIGAIGFGVQHAIARRAGMTVNHIL